MKYCTFIFAKQDNNKELFGEKIKANTLFQSEARVFFFNFFNTTLKQRASKQHFSNFVIDALEISIMQLTLSLLYHSHIFNILLKT